MSYGILAWRNTSHANMNKTVNLQKITIRTINKSGLNSHTDPLFKRSDILKPKDLYEYQTTLFMLDFINNRLPLPFNSTFQFNHQIQLDKPIYFIFHFASALLLANFHYTFTHIWNKWSSMIPNNSSRAYTNHQLKTYFLSVYHSSVKCIYCYCNDCGSK